MTNATRGRLTRKQVERLLRPVAAGRVEKKQGMTYVPQHEVRAELIRIFGPGRVEHTMIDPTLLYETRLEKPDPQYPSKGDGKPYYVACYMAGCNLRVYDYEGNIVYDCTEYHAEENAPLPNRGEAHAMALTSAQSYALRRAALSLGDAMGLHLYNEGKVEPFVKGTLMTQGDADSPLHVPTSPPTATGGVTPDAASARLQSAINNKDET